MRALGISAERMAPERTLGVSRVRQTHVSPSSDPLAELGQALSSGDVSLEPESLVALAEARLDDLDAQIGSIMLDLHARTQRGADLGEQTQVLQAVREAMVTEGNVQPGDKEDLTELFLTWQGEPVRADMLLTRYGLDGLTNGDGRARLGAIDERINQLKTESTQLNSGNELAMIRLQTLMSQRSQVIEMTTRMLNSLAESQMAVIRNLR